MSVAHHLGLVRGGHQDGISHTRDLPVKGVRGSRASLVVIWFQRPFEPAGGGSLTIGAHWKSHRAPWSGSAEYPQRAIHGLGAARAAAPGTAAG